FPGDCKFSGGVVERRSVRATYACSGGEIALTLHHPGDAPAGAQQTAQFAVVVTSGTPPGGFVDALLNHVREREGGFEWKWIGGQGTGRSPRPLLVIGGL